MKLIESSEVGRLANLVNRGRQIPNLTMGIPIEIIRFLESFSRGTRVVKLVNVATLHCIANGVNKYHKNIS